MRICIIGAGSVGSLVAHYLARQSYVSEIKLCDKAFEKAKETASRIKSDKISVYQVDACNIHELVQLSKGADVLFNALEPSFNLNLLEAALQAGSNYQDMAFGPPYENFVKMLKQSEKWTDAQLSAITATGNSPGITNIIAANAAEELDYVEDIRIFVASSLDSKKYILSWSPTTMIMDMIAEPTIFKNGQFTKVPPFSGQETYEFPAPVGHVLVSYHEHEEPYTLGRASSLLKKGLRLVEFKYGLNLLIKNLYELGILSREPVEVKGIKIAPLDVFLTALPPPIASDKLVHMIKTGDVYGSRGASVVEVTGGKTGKRVKLSYAYFYPNIIELQQKYPGATHVSYMAGISAALLTEFLGSGQIRTKGVLAPESLESDVRRKYIQKLAEQGIVVKKLG